MEKQNLMDGLLEFSKEFTGNVTEGIIIGDMHSHFGSKHNFLSHEYYLKYTMTNSSDNNSITKIVSYIDGHRMVLNTFLYILEPLVCDVLGLDCNKLNSDEIEEMAKERIKGDTLTNKQKYFIKNIYLDYKNVYVSNDIFDNFINFVKMFNLYFMEGNKINCIIDFSDSLEKLM